MPDARKHPSPGETPTSATPVALARCSDYATVADLVPTLFAACGFAPARSSHMLVKPNLLRVTSGGLACTHPRVVRAACIWLLDRGCRVTVGDSPGFGSALGVARRIGLIDALAGLDVPVVDLRRTVRVRLPFGYNVGVSRVALEADGIVNVPRLKVHGQLRITAAVKNHFGCVAGVRKALLHTRHGDQGRRFESLIIELMQALPPGVSLLDGVTAMHIRGPGGGQPFPLGLLGASVPAVALDTAVYELLGLTPEQTPLWREALERDLPGSRPETLAFPLARPDDFDARGFCIPSRLSPVSFHPVRLGISTLRRLWARLT